jgi:alkyl hydroperoxide reductase subunit AhpC
MNQDELTKLGCQVVVVSFGQREGAVRWKSKEEANCPFPVYLDRERKSYSRFNMRRSIAKV